MTGEDLLISFNFIICIPKEKQFTLMIINSKSIHLFKSTNDKFKIFGTINIILEQEDCTIGILQHINPMSQIQSHTIFFKI